MHRVQNSPELADGKAAEETSRKIKERAGAQHDLAKLPSARQITDLDKASFLLLPLLDTLKDANLPNVDPDLEDHLPFTGSLLSAMTRPAASAARYKHLRDAHIPDMLHHLHKVDEATHPERKQIQDEWVQAVVADFAERVANGGEFGQRKGKLPGNWLVNALGDAGIVGLKVRSSHAASNLLAHRRMRGCWPHRDCAPHCAMMACIDPAIRSVRGRAQIFIDKMTEEQAQHIQQHRSACAGSFLRHLPAAVQMNVATRKLGQLQPAIINNGPEHAAGNLLAGANPANLLGHLPAAEHSDGALIEQQPHADDEEPQLDPEQPHAANADQPPGHLLEELHPDAAEPHSSVVPPANGGVIVRSD